MLIGEDHQRKAATLRELGFEAAAQTVLGHSGSLPKSALNDVFGRANDHRLTNPINAKPKPPMASNPQAFFRFAGRHYALLIDLFYRSEGVTEADLRDLIARSRSEGDPLPAHVSEQLLGFGIIEPVPDATATYELTAPVRALLSFLLREHRLTSAKVIQGYLSDLEQLRAELDGAARLDHGNQAARALADISQLLERIRQDSHANREAIVAEVLKLKSNREKRSTRERFEIINRLWTRYLEPLRDLIDVRQAMDTDLDDLERVLASAAQAFRLDSALVRECSHCRSRLLRLRREVAEDFRESLREVEPLYSSLKRESELVRGASLALERLDRQGLAALGLEQILAIPVWRVEGTFADTSMEAYLWGVKGYEPKEAPVLPEATPGASLQAILPGELLARLDAALPVDDLLEWLLSCYPAASLGELLRAYGRVFLAESVHPQSAQEERRYQAPDATLLARPVRLERRA